MSNTYTIENTDGSKVLTILSGTYNGNMTGSVNSDTDLLIYGRGTFNWGAGIEQNLVRLAENWASNAENPSAAPNAQYPANFATNSNRGIAKPFIGQTWFNKSNGRLYVNVDGNNISGSWALDAEGRFLSLSGGTMNGDLVIEKSAPTIRLRATDTNAALVRFHQNNADTGWLNVHDDAFTIRHFNTASGQNNEISLLDDYITANTPIRNDVTLTGRDDELVNYGYVSTSFLPLTGGTTTGNITVTGHHPNITLDSTTVGYGGTPRVQFKGADANGDSKSIMLIYAPSADTMRFRKYDTTDGSTANEMVIYDTNTTFTQPVRVPHPTTTSSGTDVPTLTWCEDNFINASGDTIEGTNAVLDLYHTATTGTNVASGTSMLGFHATNTSGNQHEFANIYLAGSSAFRFRKFDDSGTKTAELVMSDGLTTLDTQLRLEHPVSGDNGKTAVTLGYLEGYVTDEIAAASASSSSSASSSYLSLTGGTLTGDLAMYQASSTNIVNLRSGVGNLLAFNADSGYTGDHEIQFRYENNTRASITAIPDKMSLVLRDASAAVVNYLDIEETSATFSQYLTIGRSNKSNGSLIIKARHGLAVDDAGVSEAGSANARDPWHTGFDMESATGIIFTNSSDEPQVALMSGNDGALIIRTDSAASSTSTRPALTIQEGATTFYNMAAPVIDGDYEDDSDTIITGNSTRLAQERTVHARTNKDVRSISMGGMTFSPNHNDLTGDWKWYDTDGNIFVTRNSTNVHGSVTEAHVIDYNSTKVSQFTHTLSPFIESYVQGFELHYRIPYVVKTTAASPGSIGTGTVQIRYRVFGNAASLPITANQNVSSWYTLDLGQIAIPYGRDEYVYGELSGTVVCPVEPENYFQFVFEKFGPIAGNSASNTHFEHVSILEFNYVAKIL